MVDHKNRVIFIHIPKCAGSSIEFFFGVKPFNWREPNYKTLTGWCPKRKIHMHHATVEELLETELITQDTWNSYKKFTIVRNPWSRAYSDYFWMMKDTKVEDTFENFLSSEGKFQKVLSNKEIKEYRGDHLLPQLDFISYGGEVVVENVLRFENLKEEFRDFCNKNNLPLKTLPHAKKAKKKTIDFHSFYENEKRRKMVQDIYAEDINYFRYSFPFTPPKKSILMNLKESIGWK